MSNNRQTRTTEDHTPKRVQARTFAQFREESGRAEPYPLDLGDGDVIEIPAPDTTDQVIRLSEVGDQPREALQVLCGVHYERVYGALKHEHISVFNGLLTDMAEHFGMGSAPSGSGGS